MTLGKAIEIASDAALGQNYWFGLSKRCSTDIVGGELCLGFRVLDAVSYVNVSAAGSWLAGTSSSPGIDRGKHAFVLQASHDCWL